MKKRSYFYGMLALGFLLGIHNGRLALWKDEDPEPVRVFPYSVSLLPEKDRRELKKGVPVRDGTELAKRLEDYLS